MMWEHSVASFNACTGVGGAPMSPVSTPLLLCYKRKWSCDQSFLLLHSVISCCTSLYFKFTPRKNYTDRQTRRVLILLKNVGGILLYAGLEPQEDYPHAVQSIFVAFEREMNLHMSSMSCKWQERKPLLFTMKHWICIYIYIYTHIQIYIDTDIYIYTHTECENFLTSRYESVLSSFFFLSFCYFAFLFFYWKWDYMSPKMLVG